MPRSAAIPKPRFNFKSHKSKSEETLIVMVFRYQIPSTGEKVKLLYSTQHKAKPSQWDKSASRISLTRNNLSTGKIINDDLHKIEKAAIDIWIENKKGEISRDDFRDELDYRLERRPRPTQEQVKDGYQDLIPFIDTYLKQRMAAVDAKRGTWKVLKTCRNLLDQYAEEKHPDLNYEDIGPDFRTYFLDWLYQKPRQHSTNYAAKVLSVIRQFMYAAEDRGYHRSEYFKSRQWPVKKVKTSKVIMDLDELEQLHKLDLSGPKITRLDKVRDLFLIGAYTGLRYSDFVRIKPEHIIDVDGVKLLEISTQKTNTEVVIPLVPALLSILRKHDFKPPRISNQKFNEYLKELFRYACIDEKIEVQESVGGKRRDVVREKWELAQSHMARRSFATNFYEMGIPASRLMMITGHATEKQFHEYIHRSPRKNALEMAKEIASKLPRSPR